MCRVKTLVLLAFSLAAAGSFAAPLRAQTGKAKRENEENVEERIQALEEKVRKLEELLLRRQDGGDAAVSAEPSADEQAVAKPAEQPKGTTLRVFWDKGLRAEPQDPIIGSDTPKAFTFKMGGRIQNDWAWIDEDESVAARVGGQKDGTEFRRARLYIEGEIYENFFFKAQYDFAGGDADFKDVYMGIKNVPLIGKLQVGHFKEPFSLEEHTSSKYLTFLERGLPNLFAPSRNTGVAIQNGALLQPKPEHADSKCENKEECDPRLTWAAGVFRQADDFGNTKVEGDVSASFRLTGLPYYRDGGKRLLHLGLAYNVRSPNGDVVRFRERPEVHLADRFIDTGSFAADTVHQLGIEGALVLDRFSLQSEYVLAQVDSDPFGDPTFWAFYTYGSVFLTKGDHRKYKASEGAFDRVSPKKSFFNKEGGGAWEVAFRYSKADLNDGLINGGRLSNFTGGLNWYLNPNTRVMFNAVFADLDQVGDTTAFMTRFQVDF